ncbi:MAG: lytic transglycosylase domain-containing protein [Bacteroidota bacterium]|nr:lytic transglycosylase domain-containing protein [Bacteroidota bacterium]
MRRVTLFLFFLFIILQPFFVEAGMDVPMQVQADTIITKGKIDTSNNQENKVIDEVIESKKIKKDKAEYLSKVTKYGFKDLFKNYSYNSSMPYASQVNPYAETYMQDYLNAHKDYLLKLRKTGKPYFNFIDGILTQYGLPKELKYLAVIESDLKSTALSPKGARGPWQFMPYTARGYGLVVNQNEDDRTDYFKSTNAAAKYLLSLYKDLKDWLLVIAAYNGGEGRVHSAIKKSGSHNFWKLQYDLPEESRNHVKNFIATHYIMETGNTDGNVANSNFNYSDLSANDISAITAQLTDAEKKDVDSIKVSGRYIAQVIAKNISMSIADFNHYNPGFNNVLSTGNEYKLQLPSEKMDEFKARKIQILNESVDQLLQSVKTDSKAGEPSKM